MGGLLAPDEGEVQWGTGTTALAPVRSGILLQCPERQLVGNSPLEDVAWGLGPEKKAREAAAEALTRVGLPTALWNDRLARLGRGEKRRVALAGVLARRPSLLLLDEPAIGLDPDGAARLWSEVSEYRSETGAGVVVATHWPDSLLGSADGVLCLDRGEVIFAGSVAALLEQARVSPSLRGLLPLFERLRMSVLGGAGEAGDAAAWVRAARRIFAKSSPCPQAQAPSISSKRRS
jgi:energy-coupling factor transport system ATP-binding protein